MQVLNKADMRGRSRNPVTSKIEPFAAIFNDWKLLTTVADFHLAQAATERWALKLFVPKY